MRANPSSPVPPQPTFPPAEAWQEAQQVIEEAILNDRISDSRLAHVLPVRDYIRDNLTPARS
jgi:hypothetical protein